MESNTQSKNSVNPFKKAEKKKAWIKIAITGPSGSGKTMSALRIATGMGKKIALIDTENASAALYADRHQFDTIVIDPPYTIKKYVEGISAAVKNGYDVLIIDSLSHAWAGEGGLLQQKEELDARGAAGNKQNKNQYANWAPITKQQEEFKAWLLKADIHMIVTMRSKQDYVMGEGGKVHKVGMAPVQREGMEYEFSTVLDLAMNHTAAASKDRTGLFDNQFFVPTEQTGESLMKWLDSGTGDLKRSAPRERLATQEELKRLYTIAGAANWDGAAVHDYMQKNYVNAQGVAVTSSKELCLTDYKLLVNHIMKNPKAEETEWLPEHEKLPFEKENVSA